MAYGVAKPQRGLTGVASHFNGWVKEVKGKRAFRYATISGGVSRTYGTPACANFGAPAIVMAGYLCLMRKASWATSREYEDLSLDLGRLLPKGRKNLTKTVTTDFGHSVGSSHYKCLYSMQPNFKFG